MSSEKLYNIQNIYELASGDKTFVKRLINIFITETPETINTIFIAHRNGDQETVRRLAHRIKPSIKNLGITSIVNDLLDVELGNFPDQTEAKLNKISAILVDVIVGLNEDLEAIDSE